MSEPLIVIKAVRYEIIMGVALIIVLPYFVSQHLVYSVLLSTLLLPLYLAFCFVKLTIHESFCEIKRRAIAHAEIVDYNEIESVWFRRALYSMTTTIEIVYIKKGKKKKFIKRIMGNELDILIAFFKIKNIKVKIDDVLYEYIDKETLTAFNDKEKLANTIKHLQERKKQYGY